MALPGHNNALRNTAVLCLGLRLTFHSPHQHLVGSHQRHKGLCHGIDSALACTRSVSGIPDKYSQLFCYGPRNQDSQRIITNFIVIVFFLSNNSCAAAYLPKVLSSLEGSPQFICLTLLFHGFFLTC